jgi:hypothetical protein
MDEPDRDFIRHRQNRSHSPQRSALVGCERGGVLCVQWWLQRRAPRRKRPFGLCESALAVLAKWELRCLVQRYAICRLDLFCFEQDCSWSVLFW